MMFGDTPRTSRQQLNVTCVRVNLVLRKFNLRDSKIISLGKNANPRQAVTKTVLLMNPVQVYLFRNYLFLQNNLLPC